MLGPIIVCTLVRYSRRIPVSCPDKTGHIRLLAENVGPRQLHVGAYWTLQPASRRMCVKRIRAGNVKKASPCSMAAHPFNDTYTAHKWPKRNVSGPNMTITDKELDGNLKKILRSKTDAGRRKAMAKVIEGAYRAGFDDATEEKTSIEGTPEKVRRLISHFGTQEQMARAIGIHQGGISSYLNGRHGISQTVAKTIERVTDGKFKAVDLCPRIGRHNDSRTN